MEFFGRRDANAQARLQLGLRVAGQQPPTAISLEHLVRSVVAGLERTTEEKQEEAELMELLTRYLREDGFLQEASARLDLFGSTVCLHAGRGSDLDVTLTPGFSKRLERDEKQEWIVKLSHALDRRGFKSEPIVNARVPILRIDTASHLSRGPRVDLSLENELPIFKSRLLKEYSMIDSRYWQLVLLVKKWAKTRGIASAHDLTFNSYGLSLLVLHYLQCLKPSVLPILTAPMADIDEWGVRDRCNDIEICHYTHEQLCGWRSDNDMSLVELLPGFFRYFDREFDWDEHAVCVTAKQPLPKCVVQIKTSQYPWGENDTSYDNGKSCPILVLDPLDEHDNCARNITHHTRRAILAEFRRASESNFETLLYELRSPSRLSDESPASPEEVEGAAPAPDVSKTPDQE